MSSNLSNGLSVQTANYVNFNLSHTMLIQGGHHIPYVNYVQLYVN
jgi:hypothetical protein